MKPVVIPDNGESYLEVISRVREKRRLITGHVKPKQSILRLDDENADVQAPKPKPATLKSHFGAKKAKEISNGAKKADLKYRRELGKDA